jgi:hypothetical protein
MSTRSFDSNRYSLSEKHLIKFPPCTINLCQEPPHEPQSARRNGNQRPIQAAYESILTTDALALVAKLHRAFEGVRQELLQARIDRQAAIDAGEMPDFLPETATSAKATGPSRRLPKALERRRSEITGPVEAKMVINAFNSGADSYMSRLRRLEQPEVGQPAPGPGEPVQGDSARVVVRQ